MHAGLFGIVWGMPSGGNALVPGQGGVSGQTTDKVKKEIQKLVDKFLYT